MTTPPRRSSSEITDQTPAQAGPGELLAQARAHWQVANASHHVRDVTFAEDASRLRTGNAPIVWAWIAVIVLNTLRAEGERDIAHTRRQAVLHPDQAIARYAPNGHREIKQSITPS